MTPEEHKEEAERLLDVLKGISEEYVNLTDNANPVPNTNKRITQLMDIAALVGVRLHGHSRLAYEPERRRKYGTEPL